MILSLQARNNLTIPQEFRRALRLEPGDPLDAQIEHGRLVLTPVSIIPRTLQLSPAGAEKENEADEEIAQGRVSFFDSAEDLVADLQENGSR